jgi:hypothetical protein
MLAVLGGAMVLLALFGLTRGLHALRTDDQQASDLDRATAADQQLIAEAGFTMAHLRTEQAVARELSTSFPLAIDDRSILTGVVRATGASGTVLVQEQRGTVGGAAASAGGVGDTGGGAVGAAPDSPAPMDETPDVIGLNRLPVTVTVNGPTLSALIAFAADLQHQSRLLRVDSLDITTNAGYGLQLFGAAYQRVQAAPVVPVTGHR